MGAAWRPGETPRPPVVAPDPEAAGEGGRRRLWDLGPGQHCAIVGTCLSIEDLRRVVRKAGLTIAPGTDDYSLHVHCVSSCAKPGPLARHLNKLLDKLHAGEVARTRALDTPAELLRHWRESRAKGRIAPAFWAMMTHPAIDGATTGEIYGDVHMLSHLNGSARIADLTRLDALTLRLRDSEDRLERARTDMRESLAARDATIAALEAKLAAQVVAVAPPEPRRPAESKTARLLVSLQRKLASERARARAAEAEVERLRDENEAVPGPRVESGPQAEPLPVDLTGRTVLYVGGRPNQRAHLRDAVERHRGAFLHHDGGIEQSLGAIDGLVSQADTVVCAIDCVSHGACLKLKAACRRLGRTFLPMRSASATSLSRMLPSLMESPPS